MIQVRTSQTFITEIGQLLAWDIVFNTFWMSTRLHLAPDKLLWVMFKLNTMYFHMFNVKILNALSVLRSQMIFYNHLLIVNVGD